MSLHNKIICVRCEMNGTQMDNNVLGKGASVAATTDDNITPYRHHRNILYHIVHCAH